MSQSRFSIVLVGVSALLRRPLVSRLRPADGERSPWVVFAARRCLPFRRLPLGGLTFGLTTSAFRHAPLRSCRSAGWCFRLPFRGCHSAGWPSGSRLPLFGTHRFGVALGELAFGLTASAFRHAPLRSCRSAGWFFCLPLRSCRSVSWPSGSRLPLFGTRRFGNCPRRVRSSAGRVGLRAHCFRFSARPASEITARRVGLRAHDFRFSACTASGLPSASWPSGSRLSLFGTHRSAPPHRRSEGRRSTPTRHLFHFKTLIPTC